jgi:NTE family protein
LSAGGANGVKLFSILPALKSTYVIDVKFDLLEDEKKRMYYKKLPTSFKLKPEDVDNLRQAAQIILNKSSEFQRLLNDLR